MKPMLAGEADMSALRYPLIASPKIDGIRALVTRDGLLSRSLKPIPNLFIRKRLSSIPFPLDGELVVGPSNHPNVMQATTSGVMSRDGTPEFTYYVFDVWTDSPATYVERRELLSDYLSSECLLLNSNVLPLAETWVDNEGELLEFEDRCLGHGYEGVMLRDPNGRYKFGRSTVREGFLLKLKRFVDCEVEIVGFKELQRNHNDAGVDERGYVKRSTAKAGLVGGGVLGAFIGRVVETGAEVDIGAGFTAAQRAAFWDDRDLLLGKFAKVKYFAHGVKDAPRHPVFLGFRDPIDM